MIKQKNIMELTLENLILFIEKKVTYDENRLSSQSILREEEDGIGALYLLEDIVEEFGVNFENFDFHQYFLDESELSTMTWKSLFKWEKRREIENELTIQMLFDYMISADKNSD